MCDSYSAVFFFSLSKGIKKEAMVSYKHIFIKHRKTENTWLIESPCSAQNLKSSIESIRFVSYIKNNTVHFVSLPFIVYG